MDISFDRCSGNEIAPIGWVGQKAMGLKPASDSRIMPPTRVFQLLESLKALFGASSFSCYYLHGLLAPLCVTETIARNVASLYQRGTSFIDLQPSVKMPRSPHQARKAGQSTKRLGNALVGLANIRSVFPMDLKYNARSVRLLAELSQTPRIS